MILLVCTWIWTCYCLVFDNPRLRIDFDFGWMHETVSLWLWTDAQSVRLYWCIFEFEYVITRYRMHYDVIAIAHPCAVQIHCNGDDDSALIFIECMDERRWHLTNSKYVDIGVCLNLKMTWLARCHVTLLQWRWWLCIDFRWMYRWTVSCWLWTKRPPRYSYICDVSLNLRVFSVVIVVL